jgi:hypothetical protein
MHDVVAPDVRYISGAQAKTVASLLNSTLCNLDLGTSDTCDLDALNYAAATPRIFQMTVQVVEDIPAITRACPTRPCYMATVQVSVPSSSTVYTVNINSNRDTIVKHDTASTVAPCL